MSLLGRIAVSGDRVTVHRHQDADLADGGSVRTYPTSTANVRMLLEDITDERIRRVFGADSRATVRACVHVSTPALLQDDLIAVSTGPHSGLHYRVERVLIHAYGASPHRELGLVLTSEAP